MRALLLAMGLLVFSATNVFSLEVANVSKEPAGLVVAPGQALVSLVKDAAAVVEKEGEAAFPNFKKEGGPWRHGDLYVFIIDMDGNTVLHPDPIIEGKNQSGLRDVNSKPIIQGFLDVVNGDPKEGWFHYQWPEPGSLFPLWKSSFVQLAIAPSGKKYVVGSGLYNMKMEKGFIVAVVDSAAALIEKEGRAAFPKLRDKTGPFMFMDTYVFVDSPEGVELVNGAFPNIEGRNLLDYKDSRGDSLVRDYIHVALTQGSGWVDYFWPKPGATIPSKKHTYVKKVQCGGDVFIVGSGAYLD